jgi:putative hydrolase of the HAD superfamily
MMTSRDNAKRNSEIRAVLFDAYGVLVKGSMPQWREQVDYVAHINNVPNTVPYSLTRELKGKLDQGTITEREYQKRLAAELGLEPRKTRWEKKNKGLVVNAELIGIIKGLKKNNYTVGLLTNVSRAYYLDLHRRMDLGIFDFRFASCYLGMAKPDERIFNHALNRMRMKPEHVVFVDDRAENVEGAVRVGINSLQFTSEVELKRALSKFDVKI